LKDQQSNSNADAGSLEDLAAADHGFGGTAKTAQPWLATVTAFEALLLHG